MTQPSQFRAAADINTSVFVKLTADDAIETAGAGEAADGVMHESAWATPIPGADGDVAVIAGQSKRVYQENENCEVRIGAGAVAAGDNVTADANGHAAIATTGQAINGKVIRGGAAGGRAFIQVVRGGLAA